MMAPCVIRVDSSQFLASVGSVQNALIMICVLFVIMQTNTTCDTVSIELPFLEAKGNFFFFSTDGQSFQLFMLLILKLLNLL